jgi:hypothetical protein
MGQEEMEWRTQRPQSGYTRPESGSFSFHHSPVQKKGVGQEISENTIKNNSISVYINQLQNDHMVGRIS